METTDASPHVTLRPIEDRDGYRACVELQRTTWGAAFSELVPTSVLMVARKIGGLLEGAFDADGGLLGFVFGFAGERVGRPLHWSHMLAVRPGVRGRGLGRRLKLHQRDCLLEGDLRVALWTYDPLVSRNAHLNLNRLGALVSAYEPDLYGTETNSPLHGQGGTDRFVVRWELRSERVRQAVEGTPPAPAEDWADAPVVTLDATGTAGRIADVGEGVGGRPTSAEPLFPREPRVLVEIPRDVQALNRTDPERVVRWRQLTRAAFPWYLERGYRVEGLLPAPGGDRSRYALRRVATRSDRA